MTVTRHWHTRILGLMAIAALSASWGCKQCASPYDYCPPTFTGPDCGVPCDARYRAGSILSGAGEYGDVIYEGEYDDSSPGSGQEMTYDLGVQDDENYDESGRPVELHFTAEEAYEYETPEYARRPPQLLHR